MKKHTISIFVENHSGALSRISGLFSSRGYNIQSLTVAETEDPAISRMTIVAGGDENVIEQITKQLNKLIDVIKVVDFADDPVIERELCILKIGVNRESRNEILTLANVYGGRIASISPTAVVIELTSPTTVLEEFISVVRPYGIKELVRTGKVAIAQSRK